MAGVAQATRWSTQGRLLSAETASWRWRRGKAQRFISAMPSPPRHQRHKCSVNRESLVISLRSNTNLSSAQSSPSGVHCKEVVSRDISLDKLVQGIAHHGIGMNHLHAYPSGSQSPGGDNPLSPLLDTLCRDRSRLGPALIANRLVLGEDQPPTATHQSLKPL